MRNFVKGFLKAHRAHGLKSAAEKAAVVAMMRLLRLTCGRDLMEVWFWSLTPMPVGMPGLRQYFDGFRLIALRIAYGKRGIPWRNFGV